MWPGWFETLTAQRCRLRIEEFLEENFADASLFVIKDPRLCLLMPLWSKALGAFGAETRAIHVFHDPAEVVASLEKRDGFGAEKSRLLWLRYVLAAERHTRGWPRTFVPLSDLLLDWEHVVAKVSAELGIDWPRSISSARSQTAHLLPVRQRRPRRIGEGARSIPEPARELYRALRELAASAWTADQAAAVSATFDRITVDLRSAEGPNGSMIRDSKTETVLKPAGEPSAQELDRLRCENRKLEEEIRRLRQRLASKDFELGRRNQELRGLDRRIESLTGALEEARARMVRVVSHLLELEHRDSEERGRR